MPGSRRLLWSVAMAALVIIGYILGCTTPPSGAEGAQREEYKVFQAGGASEGSAERLEALLNENAKQGWKFRGSQPSNSLIIMAR